MSSFSLLCNLASIGFLDSIIYVSRPGDSYEVETGSFLGCWTDEIAKDHGAGAKIVEYLATAPKSYVFRVQKANGDISTHIKVKGFSLDWAVGRVLSFDVMRDMILGAVERVSVESTGIRRLPDHSVVTMSTTKVFHLTFSKRVIGADLCTFPFGYK